MSTSAERRRQKANEKAKKKRSEARGVRADRRAKAPDLPDALGALAPTYVSANWADRGAKVHAAIARPDLTGRLVAALITADLASGVLTVEIDSRIMAAGWEGRVAAFGGEQTMVEVEPALVASLIQAVRGFAPWLPEPEGLGAVGRLLAGVRAADHTLGFALGLEPEAPPKPTWRERIAGLFGRGAGKSA